MENTKTLKTKLANLADAIREKTGNTDKLTLDDMVTEINNLGGMEWVNSGVTLQIAATHLLSPKVQRHGNAVIVFAFLQLEQTISEGNTIFTFNDDWKAKKRVSVMMIEGYKVALEEEYISYPFAEMEAGSTALRSRNSTRSGTSLFISFGFEAEPLT